MAGRDIEKLKSMILRHWSERPSGKAKTYVGQFFDGARIGTKITANVEGNHGTYTVSIQVEADQVTSGCSCYIGEYGDCHHCAALAATFLNNPRLFKLVKPLKLQNVENVTQLPAVLRRVTLDSLLKDLKAKGITQKAFAENIGMNPRHLSAIKSSELRNRYYNELGATKLAVIWVLEHCVPNQTN